MKAVLEKHPSALHPNPQPKKGSMNPVTIKKTKNPSTVSASAASSTTPATVGDPSDNDPSESATGTTVPSSILVSSTAPPVMVYPPNPAGFSPVNARDYTGFHPKKGQLTALPGALSELAANAAGYTKVFEPIGPPVDQLTEDLTNAAGWTTLRVKTEQFLTYVKSFEAITWKTAMADIATLNTLFKLLSEQNLQLAATFPELLKLLEVTAVIGQRGASTRSKNAKAKAAAEKTASSGTTATAAATTAAGTTPAVNPSPATSAALANGGAAH